MSHGDHLKWVVLKGTTVGKFSLGEKVVARGCSRLAHSHVIV